jgi:hypothetical protein
VPISYNYTGRVDIDPNDLSVDISESSGVFTAKLKWNLEEYKLPKKSLLQVTFNGIFERHFDALGEIGSGAGEASVDISKMRKPADVSVSLKVVEKDKSGIPTLLAFLDKKRPKVNGQDSNSESILESLLDPELKVPWRVMFDTGRPVIHISNHADMGSDLHNRPLFDMLVVPSVLESVLGWLVWDKSKDEEISDRWKDAFFELGLSPDFFDEHTGDDADYETVGKVREAGAACADEFSKRTKLLSSTAKELED